MRYIYRWFLFLYLSCLAFSKFIVFVFSCLSIVLWWSCSLFFQVFFLFYVFPFCCSYYKYVTLSLIVLQFFDFSIFSPLFCFIVIQFGRFLSIYHWVLLSFLLLLRLSFIDESVRAIFKFLIDFLCFYFLFILIVCSFSFHISVDIVSLVFHVVDFCLLKPLKY